MDKSLQQQLYGAMPRSSLGGRSSASSMSNASGRRTTLGGTTGGNYKKQGNITGVQSRYSVSGRSNHTLPGIRCSDFNTVENYGYQLPVLVSEALTFNEKNQNVSVMCADNGWAWVVQNRRLLIWQYKDTRNVGTGNSPPRNFKDLRTQQRRGAVVAQCRELRLPHCDIGHKASLVCVFISEGQQMASCIAVTPTGDARYWPSIAHDGSSVDTTGILDGQEFDKLLYLPKQHGYVLVTTTCSLIFLQLQLVNGRHVIQYKNIKRPSGFLGGFGKKFASILIGMNSGNEKENKFVALACEQSNDHEAFVTVVADRWLQRWRLTNNCTSEQLLCEDSDIIRKIQDEFHQKFWNGRAESMHISLHLLDMHYSDGKMFVLAGAVNTTHTPQMYYAIVTISTSEAETIKLQQFMPLKLTLFYNSNSEQECLNLRFIVCRTHLYLYTDKIVYPLNLGSLNAGEMDAEKIEFHLQDDRILNATVCAQLPLFFSRTHGLICVTPGDFDTTDYVNMSSSTVTQEAFSPMHSDNTLREQSMLGGTVLEQNLHIYDLDPDAMYEEFKDEVSQMKAAFVYRLKRNNNMCNEIVTNLLRATSEAQNGSSLSDASQLDKIVITIAEDLAEDIPAADPRWEQLWEESNSNKHALGSSSSLQILSQLKEKNLALRQFVEFLHATGIWDKMNAVPNGGGTLLKPTCYVISDINEKIIAATALRTKQNSYAKLVDEAINHVVEQWQESPHGNLTAQDIFYVRLYKFQDIFHALAELAEGRVESNQSTLAIAHCLLDINNIVLHMLSEVFSYRSQNVGMFTLRADKLNSYEYLPWTAMSGNVGLRDALSRLIDLTVRYGARCTHEVELKQKLYQQILELIDYILDGRRSYLDSVNDTEKFNVLEQQFESQRRDLISILIDDSQYELAAKLAEKYLDFQSLVIICDKTKNQERLDAYIEKFEEFDFSQIAINWHLRQNRQGEVFERFKGNQAALSQFMRDHPTLGWIQLVFNGDFERATKILFQLAQNETEFVQRKKSMLSLAKLAAFSSNDSDICSQVEHINTELNILTYQEQLAEHLLQAYGYDVEQQKVLKVEEIINLLISDENETATEFEFRKALELLNYLEEPYEPRHKIWCAAILRDNWTEYDVNNAMDYLQNLLFFKLIEICHFVDGDIDNLLPPMEDFLNSSELSELSSNKSFKYLLKLTYEYINDSFKKTEGEPTMEM